MVVHLADGAAAGPAGLIGQQRPRAVLGQLGHVGCQGVDPVDGAHIDHAVQRHHVLDGEVGGERRETVFRREVDIGRPGGLVALAESDGRPRGPPPPPQERNRVQGLHEAQAHPGEKT